jgi:hypothetical protein
MANPVRRIFTATLILGVPGAGKTSLLATLAEYLWGTFGKILLLYSWDGGAIPTDVQKLMQQGLIRFWRARTRSGDGLGIEGLMLATKGYWPAKINPETGETSPAVRLVPPVTTLYTVSCRKTGERLAQLPASHLITPTYCTPCKTLHAVGELNVVEDVHRTKGFELVGGVAFDGLTSMGSVVLDHMDESRGAGQIGGEKSAFGGTVVSGSVKFGGSNRADIGFGQTRARQCVHNSLSIPYLVEGPVFTALSMEATDEGGLPIVGAKLPGRAATDEASSWFGNVAEMGKVLDEAGKEHFALYLRPFTDAQNRRHLLKTSASPTGLPDVLVDPIGEPWKQANLALVYDLLNADLARAMTEEIPGAPGLAGTPTEYGEAFAISPSAVPPPTDTLPPLSPGIAAAVTPFVAPVPVGAAPPAVTARPRRRAEPAPSTSTTTPTTTTTPTPTPTTTTTDAPPPLATVGPPPPPGMKPPQRAPGS